MTDLDKVDVRTVHRKIQKGVLSQEEYDKYLSSLPDLEQEAEFVDYETQFAREAAEEAEAKKNEEEQASSEAAAQAQAAPPPAREPPPPATATALAPEPPRPPPSPAPEQGQGEDPPSS